MADKYGVWVQKQRPGGETYWGVARTTFIIDEHGKIMTIFPKVQVQGHSVEVLEALRASRS